MRTALRSEPELASNVVRLERRPAAKVLPPPLPPRVPAAKVLPVRRLAAFLMILSRTNTYEGRDAHVIADDLTCGFVKEALSMDLDTLKVALTQLAEIGLISRAPNGGLRIDDLEGLDRFCD